MQKIYFDNAATTAVREEVIAKMQDALVNSYGNPSSIHGFGRSAKTEIEQARKTIAKYLNAQTSEIIFTSGGTEADNMILRSAVKDMGVQTIITSKIEHHAVLHTAEALQKEFGIHIEFVNLDSFGNPDIQHLKQLLLADNSKKLVSLMHVNNEIGNILDIEVIAALCKANGALLHSDTVQSIGHFKWDVQRTPIDFMVAAARRSLLHMIIWKRKNNILPVLKNILLKRSE
jgi:cysteine desulfurase